MEATPTSAPLQLLVTAWLFEPLYSAAMFLQPVNGHTCAVSVGVGMFFYNGASWSLLAFVCLCWVEYCWQLASHLLS